MTVLSTMTIGAISAQPYNFTASVGSASGPKAFRPVSFGGVLALAVAIELSELVANPALRRTIGGVTGALEYVTSNSFVMANFNGYCLLQTYNFVPDKIGEDARYAGFSLAGVLIGDVV
jgi:hypothetical protein